MLAGRAPGLKEALERALAEGTPYVILDGKIVDADRCREKTLEPVDKGSGRGRRNVMEMAGFGVARAYLTSSCG